MAGVEHASELPLKLPPRLQSLLCAIPSEGGVADIGTDHGLLPAALAMRGQRGRIIAVDKREQPLQAARRTLTQWEVAHRVELRRGDGLSVLQPGEADFIVLAGLSGGQIARLLLRRETRTVVQQAKAIYCQPAQQAAELRGRLRGVGWLPIDEQLVKSGKKFYVTIVYPGAPTCLGLHPGERVSRGRAVERRSAVGDGTNEGVAAPRADAWPRKRCGTEDDVSHGDKTRDSFPNPSLLDEIGPCLWTIRPPGYREFLEDVIRRYESAYRSLQSAGSVVEQRHDKRRLFLEKRLQELKQCLEEVSTVGEA